MRKQNKKKFASTTTTTPTIPPPSHFPLGLPPLPPTCYNSGVFCNLNSPASAARFDLASRFPLYDLIWQTSWAHSGMHKRCRSSARRGPPGHSICL